MEAKKVTKEVATLELKKWLDGKKVKESKREILKVSENAIVESIMDGQSLIDADGCIVYILDFPTKNSKGEVGVKQLKFQQRINLRALKAKLKHVDSTDSDERVTAYIAAISDEHINVINGLDTNDLSYGQHIASYFL